MIDVKDFPEGTKLNFIYSAPITDFYGKKLPYRYVSTNKFDTSSIGSGIDIPFFHDKIDYSEVEYFEFEISNSADPIFITQNIVFDLPKIREVALKGFRFSKDNCEVTFNLGEEFEEFFGIIQSSSSYHGTITLNSKSQKIKLFTQFNVNYFNGVVINCDCENLTSSPYNAIYSNTNNTTYHSGFPNCKFSQTGNYYDRMPNLTYESCISILNNLYDFTGNSVTPSSSQGKLKVNANFLTTVGDEITIATNKGWTITS